MKKILQRLFKKPVTWLAERLSSSPKKDRIFTSLSALLKNIQNKKETSGLTIPFDLSTGKFIILSDEHKGVRDLADDFRLAEKNYMNALDYYFNNGFHFINLGDCEELWENKPDMVMEKNKAGFQAEMRFLQQDRYYRIFGNHDLQWKFEHLRSRYLKPFFGDTFKIYEGILLTTAYNNRQYSIFCTHGHQGDQKSDGNAFSTWFVATVWTPIQRFLEISINSTSDSFELVDKHNVIMYEWSATQKDLLFISGHTHKPVFASLDHIERLTKQLEKANAKQDREAIQNLEAQLEKRKAEYAGKQFHKTMVIPSYFNSGCCCFTDGDITGIEIEEDNIRLVKWKEENGQSHRIILEQSPLSYLFEKLSNP